MNVASPVVSTIGYQGRSIEDFIAALTAAAVNVVVDVRSKPISRRHEYSKKRLQEALESSGFTYWHVPELGMPIELLPQRSPKDGNVQILEAYRDRISDTSEALDQLEIDARHQHICLLCYEADPHHCHRGVIAEHLETEGQLEVRHL